MTRCGLAESHSPTTSCWQSSTSLSSLLISVCCAAFVNLCRDEATDGLKAQIDKTFGDSFNVNGLGGVLTCGVTGIKAGLSHSPVVRALLLKARVSACHLGVAWLKG